jgi:hypothetical protein
MDEQRELYAYLSAVIMWLVVVVVVIYLTED